MHPSCNYVQLAYSGCNTYVYPGDELWRQVYDVLPETTRHALMQLVTEQPVIVRGKPLREYRHGEETSAESYEKLVQLGPVPRTVILTRMQRRVRPAMREQAKKMLPRDASHAEIEAKLEELITQLVAGLVKGDGEVRRFACAVKDNKPGSKIVGLSVCRDGEGLAFALEGFKDDFEHPGELLKRAAATGPAMEALVGACSMLRFVPENVNNTLLTGDPTHANISLCNLASGERAWKPAKLTQRGTGMGGKGDVVNCMSLRVGTLYWLLDLNGMGGTMDGTRNTCICLLTLLGWLHWAIYSLAMQSEPAGGLL